MKNGITIRIWTNNIRMIDDKRQMTDCDSIILLTTNAIKASDISFISLKLFLFMPIFLFEIE